MRQDGSLSIVRASLLVMLLILASCGQPATSESDDPSTDVRSQPIEASTKLSSAEPTFVEIKSSGSMFCGRTAGGELWCWGESAGSAERVKTYTSPRRVPGLPLLAGFIVVRGEIIGWRNDGSLAVLQQTKGIDAPFALFNSVMVREQKKPTIFTEFKGPVRRGSGKCLFDDHRTLCRAWEPPWRFSFAELDVSLLTVDDSANCGTDADGQARMVNILSKPRRDFLGAFRSRPVPLPKPVTSTTCLAFGDGQIDACGLDASLQPACTSPNLEKDLRLAVDGSKVIALSQHEDTFCATREDSSVRCVSRSGKLPPEFAVLEGADTSLGFDVAQGVVCALGRDGVPSCWGTAGSALLGDASQDLLSRHIKKFDGARAITHHAITCALFDENTVRCFGYSSNTDRLKLPEPVDQLVGGSVLCVHGKESRHWYCRLAAESPSEWQPLRDQQGKLLGTNVADLAVTNTHIFATLRDGTVGYFPFTIQDLPFRFTLDTKHSKFPMFTQPMASVTESDRGIQQNGIGIFTDYDKSLLTPTKAVALTSRAQCYLDSTRTLRCHNDEGEWEIAATEVVQIGDRDELLRVDGTVLVTKAEYGTPRRQYEAVSGLPPMSAVPGSCGLSRAGEVWCFGPLIETNEPQLRLSPKKVQFGPSSARD